MRATPAVLCTILCACHTYKGPVYQVEEPCRSEFSAEAVYGKTKGDVVEVQAGSASGSGFIVASSGNDLLVVTNYHVIKDGDSFQLVISGGEEDDSLHVSGVEVLKVDKKNDLALLRAPRFQVGAAGLHLQPASVRVGMRIAAVGFPLVRGEPTLTFEPGDVTSAARVMEEGGEKYVQTNAAINPGNSGGPVVDACGNVIGVVVAKATLVERVGLVVPAANISKLLQSFDATREGHPDSAAREIRQRIDHFLRSAQYSKGSDAVADISRQYLKAKIEPKLRQMNERGRPLFEKVRAFIREHPGQEQDALIDEALTTQMSPDDWPYFYASLTLDSGSYDALRQFSGLIVAKSIRDVQTWTIEDVDVLPDGKTANAYVAVHHANAVERVTFPAVKEWGEWVVNDVPPTADEDAESQPPEHSANDTPSPNHSDDTADSDDGGASPQE